MFWCLAISQQVCEYRGQFAGECIIADPSHRCQLRTSRGMKAHSWGHIFEILALKSKSTTLFDMLTSSRKTNKTKNKGNKRNKCARNHAIQIQSTSSAVASFTRSMFSSKYFLQNSTRRLASALSA